MGYSYPRAENILAACHSGGKLHAQIVVYDSHVVTVGDLAKLGEYFKDTAHLPLVRAKPPLVRYGGQLSVSGLYYLRADLPRHPGGRGHVPIRVAKH